MSTYEASVDVSVHRHPTIAGQASPFEDRTASFTLHVMAKHAGPEESAHAIVAALEEAAKRARAYIEGQH